MDPLKLLQRLARTLYHQAWERPANARGWPWAVCFWLAVIAAIHLLLNAALAMIVFCAARWCMAKITEKQTKKLPVRPVWRRS